jgi:hypothetical protein
MDQSCAETPETLVIRNEGSSPLEVMVEVAPDLYVLQPGDTMEIEAVLGGAPFHINPNDAGLQIYPGNAGDPIVRINGEVAESWV